LVSDERVVNLASNLMALEGRALAIKPPRSAWLGYVKRRPKAGQRESSLLEYLGLPMSINNKVWRWKDLEGFVMLGKNESLFYNDE
jgi:hypothetical protein